MPQINTPWRIEGEYIKNCNCAPGCPCDFWAPPTYHKCEGMAGMRIIKGHFGDVKLDGLKWAVCYHWPGPLHEGNGTAQAYIDERASEEQRTALITILSGRAGNAWYEVFNSVVATKLRPKFVAIEWQFDLDKREARCAVPGEMETISEPIRNLATGDEHRIRVDMPNGMEYFAPEIATTKRLRSSGPVAFDCAAAHSSMAVVIQTHEGLKRN